VYTLNASVSGMLTLSSLGGTATVNASRTSNLNVPLHLASNLAVTTTNSLVQISGPITGTGGLTLSGSLNLIAVNSSWNPAFITINSGRLHSTSAGVSAFGNPTAGVITVNPGGTLDVSGFAASTASSFAKPLVLSGSGYSPDSGALMITANSTITSNITLAGDTTIYAAPNRLLTIGMLGVQNQGSISGNGALQLAGGGTLRLYGTATHGNTLLSAGRLEIYSPFSSALEITGRSAHIAAPVSGGLVIKGGSAVLAVAGASPISVSAGELSVTAATDQPITQTGGLVSISGPATGAISTSAGVLSLFAPNTAPVTLSGGELRLSSTGNGPIIMTGGTLKIGGTTTGPIAVTDGTVYFDSGSIAPQSITLAGGTFLPYSASLSALSPATSGGVVYYPMSRTITEPLDFSAFAAGNTLTLASTSQLTFSPAAMLKPEPLAGTLRLGKSGYAGTITIQSTLADHGNQRTHLAIASGTTTYLGTANSHSGVTTVGGTVHLTHNNALGTGTGIDDDGTVIDGGKVFASAGITAGNEKFTINTGYLGVSTTGPLQINGAAQFSGIFSGPISGSGSISFFGSTSKLSGDNTFTGQVTVPSYVWVSGESPTAFGSSLVPATIAGGTVSLSAATAKPFVLTDGMLYSSAPFLGSVVQSGGTSYFQGGGTATLALSGGTLNLGVPAAHMVQQTGGVLILGGSNASTQTYGDTFLLSGGTLRTSANDGTLTLLKAPVFNGSVSIMGLPWHLPAGFSGSGSLSLGVNATIPGPVAYSGQLALGGHITLAQGVTSGTITHHYGTLTLSNSFHHTGTLQLMSSLNVLSGTDMVVQGPVIHAGHTLRIDGNASFETLSLHAGNVTGAGTLTLGTPQLVIHGGAFSMSGALHGVSTILIRSGNFLVSGALEGVTDVTVRTAGEASVRLPTAYQGNFRVEAGGIALSTNSTTPIVLENPRSWVSVFSTPTTPRTFDNPVFLNNSVGLIVRTGTIATLNGPLDQGSTGTAITAEQDSPEEGYINQLTVKGPISGGNLTVTGPLELSLRGSSPMTGTLHIQPTVNAVLEQGGRLTAAAGIVLTKSFLHLDNSAVYEPDRIGDSVPLTLVGAALRFSNRSVPGIATETVGTVTLASGYNTITVNEQTGDPSAGARLSLAGLVRNPTATASFNHDFQGSLGGPLPSDPQLHIMDQAPTDFMGPALVVNNAHFAKYTAVGVTPFAAADYVTGGEALWTPTSHASATSATLTASRSVRTRRMHNNGSPVSLNLAGNTLNNLSGGMIFGGGTMSGGGRLTAGGDAPGTLFLNNAAITTLQSPITDNPGPDGLYAAAPGGPEDADNGQVSVVFSGGYSAIHLATANSYSGPAYIGGAGVYADHPSAFAGTPLVTIQGGSLHILNTGTFAAPPLLIRDGGSIVRPSIYDSDDEVIVGKLSSPSITLESGNIKVGVVGGGTITKTTAGTASISGFSSYTGTLRVQDGLLQVASILPVTFLESGTLQLTATTLTLSKPISFGAGSVLMMTSDAWFAPASVSIAGPGAAIVANGPYAYIKGPLDALTDALDPTRHLDLRTSGTLSIEGNVHNAGRVSGTGILHVHGGTLTMESASFPLAGGVQGYGKIVLRPAADPAHAVSTGTINLLNGGGSNIGRLEIFNHAFVVPLGPQDKQSVIAKLKGYITAGAIPAGGVPSLPAITSSTAQATPGMTIALADNADLGYSSFRGTTIDPDALIIVATRYGDASLDGQVDAFDLNLLAAHWQQSNAFWSAGDFTGDGYVDAFDLNLLAGHWQTGGFEAALSMFPALNTATPIPEPASFLLLFLGGSGLLMRRSRRRL
jgi:autotransporter-associated beta strand protein